MRCIERYWKEVENNMSSNIKLLMFVPYSIGRMDNAPKIRAYNMYHALKDIVDVTLVSRPIPDQGILKSLGSKIKGVNWICSTYGQMLSEIIQLIQKKEINCVYIEALASKLRNFDYIFLNALKKKNIPIFPFIRDLYWKYPGTLKQNKRTDKWFKYCQREYEWYINNATALLFPSRIMADTVDFPDKYVLPPAGDVSRCLNQEIPENKNITFVGGISPKMGVDILMEAMEIVVKEHPDAYCTIAGHGDKEIINKWKNKNYVTFLTDKTYKDIPDILSNTYATVIPRPRIPHNDFAMPLKLFDYMSSGRPIIATNCTAQANFIKENDIGIVTDDSPESLAEGILKLLDNRNLAERYGKNAFFAIKNKHSWMHRAKELIRIVEKY